MKKALLFLLLAAVVYLIPGRANAQKTITFTQAINPGVLSSTLVDNDGETIEQPMLATTVSDTERCDGQAVVLSAVLGESSQRLFIDNRAAASGGWTLTLAVEASASGQRVDYDDPGFGGLGCGDADRDGAGGLLSIDASDAILTALCPNCTDRAVLLGAEKEIDFARGPVLTLIRSDTPAGSWYLDGVQLTQTMPAGQTVEAYWLDLLMTTTAS